jgi:hypothetical protein
MIPYRNVPQRPYDPEKSKLEEEIANTLAQNPEGLDPELMEYARGIFPNIDVSSLSKNYQPQKVTGIVPENYNELAQQEAQDQYAMAEGLENYDELTRREVMEQEPEAPAAPQIQPKTEQPKAKPAQPPQFKIPEIKQAAPVKEVKPQQTDEIKEMISKSEKEEDKLSLLKQAAKLRDAVMGAGSGKILETDLGAYQDLEKKIQRPLKSYLLERELKDKKAKDDPNSSISKLLRDSLSKLGMSMAGFENIPYSQLEKLYPKLVDSAYNKLLIDAKKEDAAENAKYRQLLVNAKSEEALARRQEKLDKAAKLSDRQLTPINDIDNIIANVDNILNLVNSKKSEKWVGPVDARIPDLFTGAEEAAFRASVGRMTDAYRKAITGAGASAMELKKLESRLPNPTDQFDQFKAKALDFRKELYRNRNTYLKTLKKQGKDVSEFAADENLDSEDSVTFSKNYKPGSIVTLKDGSQYIIQSDGITGVKK